MKVLAIDIGGTYIKSGVVDTMGKLTKKNKQNSPDTYEMLLELIGQLAKQSSETNCIGLSCPANFDEKENKLKGSSALGYLIGKNIVEDVKDHTHKNVWIENDGNCSLLGEFFGQEIEVGTNVAKIVIGSAIGGAAIINGKLLKGANLSGAEFGYQLIDNDIEENKYKTFGGKGGSVPLVAHINALGYNVTNGEDLLTQSQNNKKIEEKLIHFLKHTAIGLINIQYILDPSRIIVGGGISESPYFIHLMKQAIDEVLRHRPSHTLIPNIVGSTLGNDANLLGITKVCFEKIGEENKK